MNGFMFEIRMNIHTQGDGSLLATSPDLPMVVAARSLDELEARVAETVRAIRGHLASLGENAAITYLRAQGVEVRRVGTTNGEQEMRIPVLVGG